MSQMKAENQCKHELYEQQENEKTSFYKLIFTKQKDNKVT